MTKVALLLALAALPAAPLHAAAQTPPRVAAAASPADQAGLVRTGSFASESLGRTMKYRVILPEDYGVSERRYVTLYLLHGLFGTYSDWESRTDVFSYSRPYALIIVMPEGENSWYTDSAGEPAQKFERYIAKDLIAHIDDTYRTIRSRHARAVAGLSMGGYGALKFALKYPGQFAFAGSISGALAAGHETAIDTSFGPKIAQQMTAIYGPEGSETRAQNDVYRLLDKADAAALPFLYLDCGTADGFLDGNRQFAQLLQNKHVAYEYRELPGSHAWDYWDRQIRALLDVLAARIPAIR
jgi:S-formylglutathione hydrolase FrmB